MRHSPTRFALAAVPLLLLGEQPIPASVSAILTCHCSNDYRYSRTQAVPLFTGGNKLRIYGADVNWATAVQIDGLAPASINSKGDGQIDISVGVLAGTAQTVRTAHVKFVGREETFQVRVVPRGTVTEILELPSQVNVNQAYWITFKGSEMNDAVINVTSNLYSGSASGSSNSASQFRTQITFKSCGTFDVRPNYLHSRAAPSWEAQSGNALYVGSATRRVVVTGCPGVPCVSSTQLLAPQMLSPTNGQAIVFQSSAQSPVPVDLSWRMPINSEPAPENTFIVTRQTNNGPVSTEIVAGTVKRYSFALPGTHRVTVKPRNCGEPAPEAAATFTTRY